MAIGVVTRNPVANPRGLDAFGHYAVSPFSFIGPTSYQAGGEVHTAQEFKLGVLEFIPAFMGITAAGTTGVIWAYNPATGAMQAFESTTGAPNVLIEVANGVDTSVFIGNGMAFGKG